MGLEPFRGLEIRSVVMGIPIAITEEVIARACRAAPEGRFLWNVGRKDPLLDSYNNLLLKGNPTAKLVDMEASDRMLLKFVNDCFFQKGGSFDQPSLDHKLVLYFLAVYQAINLPRYLMHHLCWAIKEGVKGKRKQVPCERLLSEIFFQGGLLKTLDKFNLVSDSVLGIATRKMINGKTLQYMQIIKKFSPNEKDLKESSVPLRLMRDFPSILKEGNPEVLAGYITAYSKEYDETSQGEIKGKRAQVETESEAAVALARKQKVAKFEATNYDSAQKVAKSEATNYDSVSASAPKRKKGKGDSSITQEAAKLALEEMEAEEERPSKRQSGVDIVSSMFVVTPEMAKRCKEHGDQILAEKKRKAAQYKLERDEKLKAIGLGDHGNFYEEKLAEVQEIASKVEEEAVKGAKEILTKAQGTPEADASGPIPESTASEAAVLEAAASEAHLSAKVDQIPDPQTTITPSSSVDSDLDNIPLSQKYKLPKLSPKPKLTPKTKPFKPTYPVDLQRMGEISQRRVDLCNKLPADHPLQPPIIKPLNMIPAGEPIPSSSLSNQSPTRVNPEVVGSTAVAEELADPEEPSSSELPHFDSLSNSSTPPSCVFPTFIWYFSIKYISVRATK